MKNAKNKKIGIAERICSSLDISPALLPKRPLIEIHSQSLVKIQNAGRILLYTENEIRISLATKRGFIRIDGESLRCSSYNSGGVGIHGTIRSVSFGEEDKKGAR